MRFGRRSKRGKVICQGSQHVGRSGAGTHNLPFMSPVLFRYTTCALLSFLFLKLLGLTKAELYNVSIYNGVFFGCNDLTQIM